ncbi:KAP family P-loop NTPase fold protein [Paraglaciecola sp.]|uniref:KAP family P-loop NTPase fold protein n=1 Tax=Paraglaciecola sp. TaxID=1920173 RepID=UPI003EF10C06
MLSKGSIESGSVDLSSSFDIEKYQNRLENLYKIEPLYPAVLAARNALRVLPIIALHGHFNFWISPTEVNSMGGSLIAKEGADTQKCSLNLLTTFIASQFVFQYLTSKNDEDKVNTIIGVTNGVKEVVKDCSVANKVSKGGAAAISSSLAGAVVQVAVQAISAIPMSSDSGILNAVQSATFSSTIKLTNFPKHLDELIEIVEKDLTRAEESANITDFIEQPLWQGEMPDDIKTIYHDKFIPAVNGLIKKSANQVTESLTRLLENYEALVEGSKTTSQDHYSHDGSIASENNQQRGDQLDRGKLVDGLCKQLTHIDNTEHLTIGLLGHWGTGKTRILELLKDKIQATNQSNDNQTTDFLFGEFNAWAYEHAKNNQAAMAHEVIKSLTSFQNVKSITQGMPWHTRLKNIFCNHTLQLLWTIFIRSRITLGFMLRKYPFRLIMFSVWLVVIIATVMMLWDQNISINDLVEGKGSLLQKGLPLVSLFGLWRIIKDAKVLFSQSYTKELLSYIKLPDYAAQIGEISEMREDIRLMANIRLGTQEPNCKDWLGKVLPPKRLLFVVDDLDRCGPDGIVKTFEAIRLVLDIPKVFVVIAVDQRIALAALALHYEKLSGHHQLNDAKAIARDYLAKMIQLPVVVNDGNATTLEGYLSHLWQDKEGEAVEWLSQLWPDRYVQKTPEDSENEEAEHNQPNTENVNAEPDNEENSKRLSDKQIIEQMSNLPENTSNQEINEFTGLPPEHKAAFAYWTERFELTNARQLKRLYNSYNLIRLVWEREDQLCEGTEERFAYGILVTLLAIEFVNNIENGTYRKRLGAYLRKRKDNLPLNINDTSNDNFSALVAAIKVIELAAKQHFEHLDLNKGYQVLLNSVELFVLPAIDGFDGEEAYK